MTPTMPTDQDTGPAAPNPLEVLRELEWSCPGGRCPACGRRERQMAHCYDEPFEGHTPDCRLAAVLQAPSATAEVEALRVENERLREALKPFAKACDSATDDDEGDGEDIWESGAAMEITVGDLRRARLALAPAQDASREGK